MYVNIIYIYIINISGLLYKCQWFLNSTVYQNYLKNF